MKQKPQCRLHVIERKVLNGITVNNACLPNPRIPENDHFLSFGLHLYPIYINSRCLIYYLKLSPVHLKLKQLLPNLLKRPRRIRVFPRHPLLLMSNTYTLPLHIPHLHLSHLLHHIIYFFVQLVLHFQHRLTLARLQLNMRR